MKNIIDNKKTLLIISLFFVISLSWGQNAWINEIHYDNSGSDTNEKIEIVIDDSSSYTISDFRIDLYNGNDGTSYDSETGSNFVVGAVSGTATIYTWAPSSIQNGAPDGVALSYNGTLIQFLSYEGSFTGSSGVANGVTSTDIGVAESTSTTSSESLQLAGSGCQYSDFTWQSAATNTMGNVNNSQTLCSSSSPAITINPASLIGFTYVEGNGPSAEQSFMVEGANLTADITLTPPTNWEISETSGGPFQTTPISLTQSGGTVSTTTIYTRMVSGLLNANSPFSGNIACESTGATTKNVAVDGTVSLTSSCASELIISEYIEGSSNNKYLEFYNGTGATVNMDDYDVRIYSNGNTSVSSTIHLSSANLNDGDTFVLAHSSADDTSMADQTASLGFNGDDAIELYNTATGSSVDIIGKIGEDPGSAWGSGSTTTQNHTLVRKADITSGDTDGSDNFDPATEWEGYAQDEISYLGSHTMNCGSCSAPTTDAVFDSNSPSSITSISATLSWSNGGGDKRIVVLREGSAVTFTPADDTTYTANSSFGAGTDVSGNGEYVVYNDSGSSVSLSGLSAGKHYYAKIFEYNCSAGSEKYYTSGTPAEDIFVTVPNNPADFTTGCVTQTSIEFTWSAPASGDFDGYLLVVREGNSAPHSVDSTAPSSISNANTDYGSAGEYGSTTPYSKYLYIGTNTSATITGLTAGTEYTFKLYTYAEAGSAFEYASGTQTTQTIKLNDVNDAHASPGNTKATVYWVNPTDCYDEILVVANETAGIDFTPSGDGSAYTANPNYSAPDQVVYKGNDNNVVVSDLTNGTTYYFEIFVRKGTEWSNGVEVSATPVDATEFQPGQLIFVGYDGQINGSGADDEYLIATLIDIEPGTTFSLVNSRYEAGAAAGVRTNKWGGAGDDASENPGVAEITYNGTSNIPAGSILRMQVDYSTSFITYLGVITGTTETDQTSDFSAYVVYGNTAVPNISSSGSDQMYLTQGVFIFDGTEDAEQANYTLQGTLFHGITNRAAWVDLADACNGDSSGGNTRESRLHPSLNCFNVENTDSSAISGFYQNDEIHSGSFRDIILGISDSTHWTLGTGRYTLDPSTTNESDAGHTFTISGGHNPGTWVSTSDTNWFNCSNWETLVVPDQTTDVYIDANSTVNAVIDNTATYANLYNGVASCYNLEISNLSLVVEGNQTLNIYGNLDIQSGGTFDANDSDDSTTDGQIYVYGNWTNADESNFDEGNSSVFFVGSSTQTITTNAGADTEQFYNLSIDNTSGVTFASGNIHAAGNLTIQTSPAITITAGHYLLAGIDLTNNTDIIVENEGSLVQTDDTGTVTGSGTYAIHKTTTSYSEYDYTYWSSPTDGETIESVFAANPANYIFSLNTANFSDENSGVYPQTTTGADTFDDNADDWQLATGLMSQGVGYIAMGEGSFTTPVGTPPYNTQTQSVVFDGGKVNNGVIDVTVSLDAYNTANGSGNTFNTNANLIGNPYASAIDLELFASDPDNAELTGEFYFWTHDSVIGQGVTNDGPDTYNFNNDDYATYVVGTGGTAAHSGNPVPTQYVASGQGFIANVNADGTVKFKNSMRVMANNTNFYRISSTEKNRIWLKLTDESGIYRQLLVAFVDGAADTFDRFDGNRLENGNNTDFYSMAENDTQRLAVQGLSDFNESKTIPLGIEIIEAGTYEIAIDDLEGVFTEDQAIYLEDLQTGIIHNFTDGAYQFISDVVDRDDRFVLRFTNSSLTVEENELDALAIYPNPSSAIFNISYPVDDAISIEVYDLTGKILKQQTGLQIDLSGYAKGVYFAKLRVNGLQTVKKLVLR
jgi:hypothetical protein